MVSINKIVDKLIKFKFKFKCPLCEKEHTYNSSTLSTLRCNGILVRPEVVFTSKIIELENKINSLLSEKPVCIAIRETEGDIQSPSPKPEDW